jgi:TRAP-type transport system small permease protein
VEKEDASRRRIFECKPSFDYFHTATWQQEVHLYLSKYAVRTLLVIGAIALLTIMCVTITNIFGRSFFQMPVLGAIEGAGLLGSIVISFSLFYTQLKHRNVVTSIVFNLFPNRMQEIVNKISLALSAGIVGVMAYSCAMGALEAAEEGDVTATLTIHIWPFRIAWLVGCIALCAVFFGQLFKPLNGVNHK